MNVVIGMSVLLWIAAFKVFGFNLATVLSFISTILFCGRKLNYQCKMQELLALESVGMFVTVVTQLIMRRFNLVEVIVVIVIRLVFLAIAYHEMKMYVYITKEVKREETKDVDW